MPEIRWILLGLGFVLILGIWWWGARRSRQSPGDAELREPTLGSAAANEGPEVESTREPQRDWGVPPFEPLNIRTANFDPVPDLGEPMQPRADPLEVTFDLQPGEEPPEHWSPGAAEAMPSAAVDREMPDSETAIASPPVDDAAAVDAPVAAGAVETQRIVTIRIGARGDQRWPGAALMAQLHENGLVYGRYHVFHRKCTDGRTLFCAASLVEPGTFDVVRMLHEEFRGVTLFAVLPGPLEPLQTLDELFATAHELALSLDGVVQDANGVPFNAQRAEALREDVARFQALLG